MKIDLTSGILECVGAKVSGDITATSLTLSGCQIPASDINGLSQVATTGKYDDLSNKPTIPSSVEELGFDPSEVMYKGDITQSTQEDEYGNSYLETQVPTKDGGYITYATYNAGDYLIFGYSRGTDTNGTDREGEVEGYFCVSTDGLLTAKNALIYGTIYATDGEFIGDITARSLTLSGCKILTDDIDGLSSVATSGNYNDLSDKPTKPNSIKDLNDASNIMYKGEINQSTQTDKYGNSYFETRVPTGNGNYITYATYNAEDYLIFGYSRGTDSDGKDYICISKEGLLTARNALIYGTVYATDGEFTGKITANEGKIGNWFIGTNGLYDADPKGTTSVFLVPGGKSVSTSNNDKFVISVGQYSNFNSDETNDGNSYFGVTTAGKLYAKGGTFKGHLSAWSGTIGGCTISGGSIKGTGWEVSGTGIAINGINMTTLKTASIPVYTPYTYTAQGA